jgi:hypothetical protein
MHIRKGNSTWDARRCAFGVELRLLFCRVDLHINAMEDEENAD